VRWDTEIYGRASGKETIIIDASLCPVKDEQGRVVFIAAEGRDITEKKAYEREIARQREELAKLDELKTQSFANISHEFRTPLTLMLGPLQDFVTDEQVPLSTSQREQITMVHRNGLRLQKLVNALLDFSRVQAGRVRALYQPTDLAALTCALASNFQSACEKAGLRLNIETPTLPKPVFVDQEMWEKIVLNLLSNAFKFTLEGEITVALFEENGYAVLQVRDTGIGIPASEVPLIFDRFHRIEGAQGRTHEGTGIGLALVKELIELHRGSVRVESSVGEGSTFTARVPLGFNHLPRDRIDSTRPQVSTATRADAFVSEALRWLPDNTPAGEVESPCDALPTTRSTAEEPGSVLIVDDNADMRDYLCRILAGTYKIVACSDGEQALLAARRSRPDVVITDIMMPRLDGFGLLRQFRNDTELSNVPVVVLSARAGDEAKIEGLQKGADDYLVKPFSPGELLARVAANIEKGRLYRASQDEIAKRKDVEAALRASDERLNMALSAGNSIGTWDWDVVNDKVFADHRFAKLYGVDPERAREGAPIAEFFSGIHPDDVEAVQAKVAIALKTGEPFTSKYRLRQTDGTVRLVVAQGRSQRSDDGTPLRFPGVSFDITDRKLAEERLRELNADLERRVIERAQARGRTWQVSPDLLGALNANGYFETSNPAWKTVLGWTEDEVAKMSIFELLHPDDVERTREGFNLTLHGQPAIEFPNRYRCKDGSYRWISWVGVPEDGLVYCTGRDITRQIEQQEALKQAEDTLRQSQKMEAVGQLTGGLAHDFNNLLTAISGSFQMIQPRTAQGRMEAVDRYVAAGQNAVKRAAALTHRLLAFSRRQTLDAKPTNINQLIGGMEDLIRRTVGPSVQMEVIGAGGLWATLVDQNQLENALLNLCINARDAMPDGGRLTIETANRWLDDRAAGTRELKPGQYVSLSVTDTGTGMTGEVIAHAFEPFFTTKPLGAGTGLGLSMIYGFARQSGGQIQIYSEVGKGTTMCLYLPRHDNEVGQEEPAVQRSAVPSRHGEVVLVVDDESAIRMLIAEVLAELGYSTIEAPDGPAGMRVLQSPARIDLLITDVGLPNGFNGRQVADAARELRPDLKVLFITGYAKNAVIGHGNLERGMQVMFKPFDVDGLARKIRELIEG
jgi:PAS domain S-box-containing protein